VILPSLSAAVAADSGSAPAAAAGACSQPLQVFQELRRCAGLLARPGVAAALKGELEAAAALMDRHLEQLQQEMERHREAAEQLRDGHPGAGVASAMGCNISSGWRDSCGPAGPQPSVAGAWVAQHAPAFSQPSARPPHLPAGVADVISWSLQCHFKVRRAQEALQLLLGPGDGAGRPAAVPLKACLGAAAELLKELDALKKEHFEAWQVGGGWRTIA
jgi:hypothetical protein